MTNSVQPPSLTEEEQQRLQRSCNAFARRCGYARATKITFADVPTMQLGEALPCGYRKYTTGQYVPNAYRRKFGWKNTFYQHAITEVLVPLNYKP